MKLKHNLNVFVRAPVLRKETYLKTPPGGQTDTWQNMKERKIILKSS